MHLKIAGPILGKLLFPYDGGGLHFSTDPLVYVIGLLPFLAVRLAVYSALKLRNSWFLP